MALIMKYHSGKFLFFIKEFSFMLEYKEDLDIAKLKAERKALEVVDRNYILNRFNLIK
jgi:hypothetical protein